MERLRVDPDRLVAGDGATGIYIRALDESDRWCSCDIAQLDKASLLAFLRCRGGDNPWAEDVIGIILGHGRLHDRGE